MNAADLIDTMRENGADNSFCCPLIGLYRCERERRGCYCHELHLKDHHAPTMLLQDRGST